MEEPDLQSLSSNEADIQKYFKDALANLEPDLLIESALVQSEYMQQELSKLEREMAKEKQQNTSLTRKNKEYQVENEKLKEERQQLRDKVSKIEKLESLNHQLENDLNSLRSLHHKIIHSKRVQLANKIADGLELLKGN